MMKSNLSIFPKVEICQDSRVASPATDRGAYWAMDSAGVAADMTESTGPGSSGRGGRDEDEEALAAAVGDGGGGQSQATQ